MSPMINRDIFKDNPYEPEFAITKKKTDTRALIPGAGVVGATISISATKSGPPIHADLTAAAVEASAKPGYYFAQFTAVAINARLFPTYANKVVYVIWDGGAAGKVNDPVTCYTERLAG
jgi:hypothetical protein